MESGDCGTRTRDLRLQTGALPPELNHRCVRPFRAAAYAQPTRAARTREDSRASTADDTFRTNSGRSGESTAPNVARLTGLEPAMKEYRGITPGRAAVGNALPSRAVIGPCSVHPQPYPRTRLRLRPRFTGTPCPRRFRCALSLLCDRRLMWPARKDSNFRPRPSHGRALPLRHGRNILVPKLGFEPRSRCF